MRLYWWSGNTNVGDALNPLLVAGLAGNGTKVLSHPSTKLPLLFAVGSVVHLLADKFHALNHHEHMTAPLATIWGTGCIGAYQCRTVCRACRSNGTTFLAVRGPLSRQTLSEYDCGCQVPPVYGDPALLLPFVLPREGFDARSPEYDLCVCPHDVDKKIPAVLSLVQRANANTLSAGAGQEPRVKMLDILSNVRDFVAELLTCRAVVSSSLHGVIISEAYGIQATAVFFSRGHIVGGAYKYQDYGASLGRSRMVSTPRFVIGENATAKALLMLARAAVPPNLEILRFRRSELIRTCPFLKKDRREHLLALIKDVHHERKLRFQARI